MSSFSVVLHAEASLLVDGEPSDFVTEYDLSIVRTDEDDNQTVAGHLRASRLHAGLALDHSEPLFDVCDAHSQEMHEAHALLYKPSGYEFRGGLAERFDAYEADLLVLDYVVLDPRWRGLKLGLLAARKAIDLLGGGCGLVASDIRPLLRPGHPAGHAGREWPAEWLPEYPTKESWLSATRGMRSYFRRMGFERLGRTPYYALSPAQRHPTAADLLRPRAPAGG